MTIPDTPLNALYFFPKPRTESFIPLDRICYNSYMVPFFPTEMEAPRR